MNGNNSRSDDDIWTLWFSNWTARVNNDDVIVNTSSSADNNESFWMMDNNGVLVDWDDWDRSLWTPEQRQLLERGAIPRHVHITLGILLSLIVLFGVAANSTILYVFSRFWFIQFLRLLSIINSFISFGKQIQTIENSGQRVHHQFDNLRFLRLLSPSAGRLFLIQGTMVFRSNRYRE